ncbi:MAG: oxygen-insensitive NADPH nitroreductase [Chloroflexi bacterium]|nr:MAG: oxygen-insensitive NADPH nitroreductase [Chloroflexota bacterium]
MVNTVTETETTRTLKQHVSIRRYTADPIPDPMLQSILDAARRSPTSSNLQTYSIIVVRDETTKAKLAELSGNQRQVAECPVFLAICADIHRLQRAAALHGKDVAVNLELSMVATVDAALVGMSAATAAESFGLGTVMIGGIRNNPQEVAEVLDLPEGVFVVFGLCMGWPAEQPPQKPRLPHAVVVHEERYHTENIDEALKAYDEALAEHYRAQGRNTPDAAWTGIIASRFETPRRAFLHDVLEKRGFRWD